MTTCPRSERFIALFHDGELDGPLRREMMSHIAGCILCTRALAAVARIQELVFQTISDQVEETDFSHFWDGVESKIVHQDSPPWGVRLRLWFERWRLAWPPATPAWAAAAVIMTTTALFLSHTPPANDTTPVSSKPPSPVLVAKANDQAQIESLSATATVFLWNEPENNATVIWVSDNAEGGMP